MVASVIGGMAGGIALANRNVGSIGSARWPLFVVGLVLMVARVFVRQLSIITLGQFFTFDVRVHPDHTVVERDPYQCVRTL